MREIVICPKCGYVGSIEYGDDVPICPECGCQLVNTHYDAETWNEKSEKDKKAFIQAILSDMHRFSPDSARTEGYLKEIAENTRSIKGWVQFWSILVILSFLIGLFLFLNFSSKVLPAFRLY